MPIAALPAVALALAAILVLYGLVAFGRGLAGGIARAPIQLPLNLNKLIAGVIMAGVDAVQVVLDLLVGDLVMPVVNFIVAPVFAFINFMQSVFTFTGQVASEMVWIIDYAIPRVIARALSDAQHYYNLAAAYASKAATNVLHEAQHLYNLTNATIAKLHADLAYGVHLYYRLARQYAQDLVNQAVRDIGGDVVAVDAKIAAATTSMVKYADAEAARTLSAAEIYATGAAAVTVGTLVTDVDVALAPVATGLIDDVGSLVGVLATDFPDVGAIVRGIDLTKVGDLTGALVGTMSMVRALTRLAEDCTVPNCRNLSQYGRDLQSLFGLVEDASFLALIVEMIHDPLGAAHDINDLFGGIVNGAVDTVRAMVNI